MQGGRNRTQAEEQNQKDGNRAPHLDFMLHEGQMRATQACAAVSYHPSKCLRGNDCE
jgi:hypothetical protein